MGTVSAYPVPLLFVTIMVPVLSCFASVVATPLTFIAVSGVFVKLLTLTLPAANELEDFVSRQEIPTWINDCLSADQQLDFSHIDENNAELLTVALDLRAMSKLMIIVCCLTSLFLCCLLTASVCFMCEERVKECFGINMEQNDDVDDVDDCYTNQ